VSSTIDIHKSVAFRAMKGLEEYTINNKRVRLDLVRERTRR
jgi:hypothetical protein